jgi:hypothetical protein
MAKAKKEAKPVQVSLAKELPPPVPKFIGDLSNAESVIAGLDLRSEK